MDKSVGLHLNLLGNEDAITFDSGNAQTPFAQSDGLKVVTLDWRPEEDFAQCSLDSAAAAYSARC